jgi:uncharacterized coiled-coil protein SlyX
MKSMTSQDIGHDHGQAMAELRNGYALERAQLRRVYAKLREVYLREMHRQPGAAKHAGTAELIVGLIDTVEQLNQRIDAQQQQIEQLKEQLNRRNGA